MGGRRRIIGRGGEGRASTVLLYVHQSGERIWAVGGVSKRRHVVLGLDESCRTYVHQYCIILDQVSISRKMFIVYVINK